MHESLKINWALRVLELTTQAGNDTRAARLAQEILSYNQEPEIRTEYVRVPNDPDYSVLPIELLMAKGDSAFRIDANRIQAIKSYKHRTGVGLLEAKVVIEESMRRGEAAGHELASRIIENPRAYM
jgi:hypothetical protein